MLTEHSDDSQKGVRLCVQGRTRSHPQRRQAFPAPTAMICAGHWTGLSMTKYSPICVFTAMSVGVQQLWFAWLSCRIRDAGPALQRRQRSSRQYLAGSCPSQTRSGFHITNCNQRPLASTPSASVTSIEVICLRQQASRGVSNASQCARGAHGTVFAVGGSEVFQADATSSLAYRTAGLFTSELGNAE